MSSFLSRYVSLLGWIGLTILVYPEAWGLDWKYYGKSEDASYFYEKESIKRLSKNIIRIYVQSVYTQKGISHWVKEGGEKFKNLDFSIVLSEYHCLERSIQHLNIFFYSKNGEIFNPVKNDEWHFFIPDLMSEPLFETICK